MWAVCGAVAVCHPAHTDQQGECPYSTSVPALPAQGESTDTGRVARLSTASDQIPEGEGRAQEGRGWRVDNEGGTMMPLPEWIYKASASKPPPKPGCSPPSPREGN